MAGVRIATIEAEFGHDRIVRVMPNTPVAAKAGMSVWTATPRRQRRAARPRRGLLGSIGREIYVDDEKKLDMATAVSGSGPGYVFLFIEAMIEGARRHRTDARTGGGDGAPDRLRLGAVSRRRAAAAPPTCARW